MSRRKIECIINEVIKAIEKKIACNISSGEKKWKNAIVEHCKIPRKHYAQQCYLSVSNRPLLIIGID